MNYREEDEDALMEQAGRDDRSAFDEIVRRYQHRLQRYAARMLASDPSAAADVAVEAFVRLWERRREHRQCGRLSAWLYRTTHRLVLDEVSRTKTLYGLDDEMFGACDVAHMLERRSEADAAKAAVSRLSAPLRTVFILSVYEEMSYEEIADTLEISPGTVASRKHEAVEVLRRKLNAWREAI